MTENSLAGFSINQLHGGFHAVLNFFQVHSFIILYVQEVVTHFIIVSYYIKWGTTSRTYSMQLKQYARVGLESVPRNAQYIPLLLCVQEVVTHFI